MDYDDFEDYDDEGDLFSTTIEIEDSIEDFMMNSSAVYCFRCGKNVKSNPKKCTACNFAVYCTAKCLKADKTTHHGTCGLAPNVTAAAATMLGGAGSIYSAAYKKKAAASKGTGYGGDARNDERQRKAGKKQAAKRETQEWKEWQAELQAFLKKPHGASKEKDEAACSSILNTLKQVLRCQAPEWWWKQPQRKLYITALQVCAILTEHYPKEWGDPDDEESAISALEELAQTSKLLVKQLGKNDDKETASPAAATGLLATATSWITSKMSSPSNQEEESTDKEMNAAAWLSQQLKSNSKNTHDKDASLPTGVIKLRDEAAKTVAAVLEAPECSMMGSQDYYRQILRPMAFETIESFEAPKHYYSAGGGHERNPYGGAIHGVPSWNKQPKNAKKNKSNENSIKSSAAVLWKELSSYPTALPIEYGSSIFVRALENEMDKLRVLIIGPDETPYANGCFVFDVHMGNDYPHKPPKVQLLTTSSFLSASDQKVRFNPNLYDCGKVCLSLLGTWSGPGWQRGESTLLQVLVSIQSLILGTADPYFNEPGFDGTQGTTHGDQASERYNTNIRKQTLRVAILPFLQNQLRDGGGAKKQPARGKRKDPPGLDATNTTHFAEFKDVIEQHFKLKKQAIQKQLFQWLEKDKSLQTLYTEYWSVFDQLEEEARLQAAVTSGTAKRQQKRAKVDAPAVKMKDGVILLDDDDDDDDDGLQEALANSLAASTASAAQPKENGDGVIELADSDDDEDMNRKPAAVKTITSEDADTSNGDHREEKKEDPEEVEQAVASLPKESANDEVVDLT